MRWSRNFLATSGSLIRSHTSRNLLLRQSKVVIFINLIVTNLEDILDKASRGADIQTKVKTFTDWELVFLNETSEFWCS